MKYSDRLYGSIEIDEPVLIAVIHSATLRRLQGVLQHGITGLLGITRPTTRFEHTMGVFCLVRRFGGSLEEQIAALLHDASHTAFSHVIDYVFESHNSQDYHEQQKIPYLEQSDIPAILESFALDWRDYVDERIFSLLEQDAPALCADRLDYFLRDCVDLGLGTVAEVNNALAKLLIWQNRFAVSDRDAAEWLARTYLAADKASWANFREVGLYELTAQAIRFALEKNIISTADFWGGDQALWQKLNRSDDVALRAKLSLVNRRTHFEWDEDNPDFRVGTKLRTIDPDILINDRLSRLSELDSSFAATIAQYLDENRGAWPVRVIPGP